MMAYRSAIFFHAQWRLFDSVAWPEGPTLVDSVAWDQSKALKGQLWSTAR
ncbi:hypothetical protein AWB67_01362 [Caballeronia terrestris]|uniref:Uncharacterized protein n=1 Tax=Caballeronia terrestris TaxID=1226301 RepID=A0A158GQV6_9BURK|nr:hypothetical protein AWB67_01362 [Caballeronia terrestris]